MFPSTINSSRFDTKKNPRSGPLSSRTVIKKLTTDINVCFVVDCTHSMKPYIKEIGEKIFEIVDTLRPFTKDNKFRLRISFVGYYDYNNKDTYYDLFVKDFTVNYEDFSAYVMAIETQSGYDCAEDVLGGLNTVNSLNWTNGHNMIFHFADAPGHGWGASGLSAGDISRFKEGHPNDVPYTDILKTFQSNGIYYNFAKITEFCDYMINDFMKVININIMDMKSPYDMAKTVGITIHDTITCTVETKDRTIFREHKTGSPFCPSKVTRYPIKNYDLTQYDTEELYISVMYDKKISEGCLKYAFEGKAIVKNKTLDVVIKCLKSNKTSGKQDLLMEVKLISLAGSLSAAFNRALSNELWKIKYLESYLVENKNGFFILEKPIDTKTYKKFTNNGMYIDRNDAYINIITAYSHFTYVETKHKFMVVDLQGIISEKYKTVVLTDPAFHSSEKICGVTDFGTEGFKNFFQIHECNSYCEALGIQHDRL